MYKLANVFIYYFFRKQIFVKMNYSKSNADALRIEGNQLYSDRNFFDALIKYNESLCNAMPGSDSAGYAYANRSAVFFEMKLYDKCINNIELAKLNGYPRDNYHVLNKRLEKCIENQANANDEHEKLLVENPFEFVKLSYQQNASLPFVVDCLKLRQNDTFGRYIVASQDLKVGDILAIEEPYFKVLKSDARYESCQETNKYQRCSVCLQDNSMDLIPCPECCSSN